MREYKDWLQENHTELEIEFLSDFCSEGTPLDDDTPDFMDTHCEEFEDFCQTKFETDMNR